MKAKITNRMLFVVVVNEPVSFNLILACPNENETKQECHKICDEGLEILVGLLWNPHFQASF